ncbi:conserved hypothetical protein [Trichinella spiralis]|nr:conserved hypothetical protein [Trichinella spiralis]
MTNQKPFNIIVTLSTGFSNANDSLINDRNILINLTIKTLPASWINDQDDDDDSALENVGQYLPEYPGKVRLQQLASVDCVRKIEEYPTGSGKMTRIANKQPAGSLLICL